VDKSLAAEPLLSLAVTVTSEQRVESEAILCDFMTEGHLGRHIRRMRDMYAERLAALQHEARKYLSGLLDVSPIQAGLNTAGFLRKACHLGKRKR
jgi:GntR family transcriptional regulator/MocR family aminotransferase